MSADARVKISTLTLSIQENDAAFAAIGENTSCEEDLIPQPTVV
jgi:hypothetical protein